MLNIFVRVDSYADMVARVNGFERSFKELYPDKSFQKMDLTFDGGRTVVGCHIFVTHVTIKVIRCIPGEVEEFLAKLDDRFGWKPHFTYQAYAAVGGRGPIPVYDNNLTVIKMVDAYYSWESGGIIAPECPAFYHIFERLFEQAKVVERNKQKLNEKFGTQSTSRDYVDTDNIDAMRYGLEAMRKYWEDDEAVTSKILKDLEIKRCNNNDEKPIHWLKKEVMNMQFKGYNGYTVLAPIWGSKDIKKVIFNDPATIVIWYDGTKTVVKATNEKFDPEKGLAMAFAKKYLGNKGNYYETFKKWLPKEVKKNEKSGRRSVRKKKA